ncbi:MAG TPA: EAL domain-containing protein [Chloroflexota bacterium]|jgi:diguanylate cyclase (GGDEF)-like protein/PAS domain S-box-containing protein|nr:EAL domain-containing protein [Chloroflexota bacterium]
MRTKALSFSFVQRLRDWLPTGGTLSDESWQQRHRIIIVLLWLHVFGLAFYGVATGRTLGHAVTEVAVVALAALGARARAFKRPVRSVIATLGLLTASALLVHLAEGQTEAHFHFFVMLAVVALYLDWLPFLVGVGYVVLEHGTIGVLLPHQVYDNPAAWSEPWKWALIHGGFVAAFCIAIIAQWRLAELSQVERRRAALTQARLAAIVTSSSDAILGTDSTGLVTSWNKGAEDLFGYTAAEILGRPLGATLVLSAWRDPKRGDAVFEGRRIPYLEVPCLHKNGSLIHVGGSVSPVTDEKGELTGISYIARDISERLRRDAALRESQRALETLISNLPGMTYRWRNDTARSAEFVSEGCLELTGYRADDMVDARVSYQQLIHPADRDQVVLEIHAAILGQRAFQVQYRIEPAGGGEKWVWEQGRGVFDEAGTLLALEGLVLDVSERRQAETALQHQALHDALTDLPNRNLLRHDVEQATALGLQAHETTALLVLDLDRFKEINDTLGHDHGDLLLREVAIRLRQEVAPGASVARLGGDEFAVLLPRTDTVQVQHHARALIAALRKPFALDGYSVETGVSIGIALAPEHGSDFETLLRRADIAMYVAKQNGSGVAVYTANQDVHSPERLALIGELRQAIESGALLLHYQPKIECATGELAGVEALVRWSHAERGLIPPDRFISLAEQTGLIRPLTQWVIHTALQQCRVWRDNGLVMPVAVNLSMRNLHESDLVETITAALAASQLPSSALELEITESSLMVYPDLALGVLTQLSDMGIRIAVDDFGTGYSSLAYLKDLPVHELKIDRSFVGDMRQTTRNHAIVRSTIDLAHHLGLRVVAEGVEDQQTWDLLRSVGCDVAQGYYLSRPLAAERVLAWARAAYASPMDDRQAA